MNAFLPLSLALLLTMTVSAQPAGFNYDEDKVPEFTLVDPLDGVESASDWPARRTELFRLFETQMFGKAPEMREVTTSPGPAAFEILDGMAVVEQPVIHLAGCRLKLLVVRPKQVNKAPAVLAYNFDGNHTVHPDPRIELAEGWNRTAKDHLFREADRGKKAPRWDIPLLIKEGFALVTLYYGDVDPDMDDGFTNGVHAAYPQPAAGEWGSIATWSWALRHILTELESHPHINGKQVGVFGHSRLGKTSLWAGAVDQRFAFVISNNSGCGGAALSARQFGETVKRINTSFPHWFCGNYKQYNEDPASAPFDQHLLIALMAPRPVYIGSAEGDRWADPRGEFLSALHASPVYELLGTEGLPATNMPDVHAPIHGRIGYHIRAGKHDVQSYDWEQYISFAVNHLNTAR